MSMKNNESDESAMEIDVVKPDSTSPRYSINVLQLLKSAQMQHGLRHGDYTRYRRYCTARLRRLYKSLKFTHGRVKYTRRAINEAVVTEVRFLHIVLYSAERAWSHAMEKRQVPDGPSPRQRVYLIGRLRKAVKWADLFSRLCAIKGDSRTSLEAEAYAAYMNGTLLFEQDRNWNTAYKNFVSARAVYEELGKYGDVENQILCRERVEELEPSIRYCRHKIGDSNMKTSDLLQISEMEGPALDLFKAKLEAAMSEARIQQASSLTEFMWLGYKFPISNAKTRVAILKAKELEKDLQSDAAPNEKKLAIFDKIFAAYNEARTSIRNDLANAGNADGVREELNGLDKAVSAVLSERTIERNELLVSITKGKLTKRKDEKNDKITRPEELVRLFDLLLQNTSDLSDLLTSARDRKPQEIEYSDLCETKNLSFKAERCFYLAKSYALAGERAEAYVLYSRASVLAEDALKKLNSQKPRNEQMVKELEALRVECRKGKCIEHANGILEEEKVREDLSNKMSSIGLNGEVKKGERMLFDNLEAYESAIEGKVHILQFPPAFESISRNPIVLDLAYNAIDFPSIDHRIKKDKKGFISRLWR